MKSMHSIAALCAGFGVLAAIPQAAALPVTFFSNSTSVIDAGSRNCAATACATDPTVFAQQFDPAGGLVSTNRSGVFAEGTTAASSNANLASGSLGALSQVTANGANGNLFSFATASFGDSFRTFSGGSPFTWTSTTQVGFSFDISGLTNLAGATNGAQLNLSILAPGELDAYSQFINGSGMPPPTSLFDFSYNLGPGGTVFPFTTGTVNSFPNTVNATFTPGGDFDWVLSLITHTALDTTANPSGSGLLDFSNTVLASYIAPPGTSTYSASGLFPGTLALSTAPVSDVPIPGALIFMISGLAGIGWLRKRKST